MDPPYGLGPWTALGTGPQTTPSDPLYGPPQNNAEIKVNKIKEITEDLTYQLSG